TGLRAAVRLPLRLAEVSLQAAFVGESAVRAGAPAAAQRRARLVLEVEGDPLEADVAARHLDGAPQDLVERLTASELLGRRQHRHDAGGPVGVAGLPSLEPVPGVRLPIDGTRFFEHAPASPRPNDAETLITHACIRLQGEASKIMNQTCPKYHSTDIKDGAEVARQHCLPDRSGFGRSVYHEPLSAAVLQGVR